MGEEQRQESALDTLNQQFMQMQRDALEGSDASGFKKAISRWKLMTQKQRLNITGIAVILLAVIFTVGFILYHQIVSSNFAESTESLKKYQQYLTSEEKKSWKEKEVDDQRVFVEVNTQVTVDKKTKKAVLHLVNPPYSAFDLSIEAYLSEEPKTQVYQSERIEPGTVVEEVELSEDLDEGVYPVTIRYTFYDGDKMLGAHLVAAEFLVQ